MIKKINTVFCIALLSLGVSSCDDKVESANSFNVSTEKLNFKVGEPVNFSFEGNPDYITFYSGEPNNEYKHRFRTEIDPSDIEKVELTFDVFAQYGSAAPHQPEYPLRVFITDQFDGLKKDSNEKDEERIAELETVAADVTEASDMPSKANERKSISLDISEYANNFTLALKYEGYMDPSAAQRTFTLSNLKINSKLKNGQELSIAQAMDMGFIAYDMSELPDQAEGSPYYIGATNGSWNLNNIGKNEFKIAGGPKGFHANLDWLISTPMKLNKAMPDKGNAIKDITISVSNYIFTYNKPGKYEVSFVGGNANHKGQKEVVRTLVLDITE